MDDSPSKQGNTAGVPTGLPNQPHCSTVTRLVMERMLTEGFLTSVLGLFPISTRLVWEGHFAGFDTCIAARRLQHSGQAKNGLALLSLQRKRGKRKHGVPPQKRKRRQALTYHHIMGYLTGLWKRLPRSASILLVVMHSAFTTAMTQLCGWCYCSCR